ncbi:YceI protein [Cellvibrio sp. BR]|jgi:polyisoprenoid-binding protein YceI|uniref:YceI family protein n=1 Tax=unclassified Cellvibrio TaxID=2624793 RepID=UPI0002601700|nr:MULTISPECIES: YceI family protein [unclassified Cellvibrio]EIK46299.1 YceI protein [Cellvibrio sp. BR]QEY11620.1 YceI family protein [Cellvibrio sp. KY-YJ-3]UUA71796.1 YceI family protein [Cellvibrio sp. QJXJ]
MLKKSLLALAVSSIGVMSLPALADTYEIDAKGAHASINFAVKHLGYSWLTGRFDTFSGEFTYDPAKPEASTINVTIDTTSVNSNHAERDKHLRSPDFLNVEKFPKATFVSKQIKVDGDDKDEFDIIGDLTLNGVTKSITIEVDKVGEGKDPWGGYRAGFEGETEINMKDFNIKMDLGPASQTVKLELHVEGIKK